MSNHLLAKYPKYQKFKISAHLPWGRGRTVFFCGAPFYIVPQYQLLNFIGSQGRSLLPASGMRCLPPDGPAVPGPELRTIWLTPCRG